MSATNSNEQDFLRKKYTTSIAFAVGVLLFLLPFVEIRCNDTAVAQNSGIGLAFGSDFKASKELRSMDRSFGGENRADEANNDMEGKFYVAALIALLLGLVGIMVSYRQKGLGRINILLGVAAALAMIILLIQMKADINERSEIKDVENQLADLRFTAEFTPWFYLSLISFLVAAFLSYKKNQLSPEGTGIPKNAPQLDLQNPGDQSDFPKPPSESEVG